MKDSKIEWCDHTFNPWIGCTKKSPGCKNCYALARDLRFSGGAHWGKGAPRKRTSAANWRQPLRWNETAIGVAHREGRKTIVLPRRPRVFCASLADWLDEEIPVQWLVDLLSLIHQTPDLDWLLLTKRPENWLLRMDEAFCHAGTTDGNHSAYKLLEGWLGEFGAHVTPGNIWIGTTTENQEMVNERIPLLLEIPAKVRFLSIEPMLSKIQLRCAFGSPEQIHWVICGGESGPGARPMHPDWARSLLDQCEAAGVAFFFKQWGQYAPSCAQYPRSEAEHAEAERAGNHGDIAIEPNGTIPEGYQPISGRTWLMNRVGKTAAGRLLDGAEWNEFPA